MPPFPQAFTGLHYSHTSLHKEPAQKPKPSYDLGHVITLYIMKTTRRSWILGNKELFTCAMQASVTGHLPQRCLLLVSPL